MKQPKTRRSRKLLTAYPEMERVDFSTAWPAPLVEALDLFLDETNDARKHAGKSGEVTKAYVSATALLLAYPRLKEIFDQIVAVPGEDGI